jgi:hypothetical protein
MSRFYKKYKTSPKITSYRAKFKPYVPEKPKAIEIKA